MIQEAANWYFIPRAFEAGNFYPRLGVRIYKKYLPTSGEVISRFRGIDRLKIAATGSRRQALLNYELQTRTWEGRHLVSAALLQAWAVIGGAIVDMEQFWTSSVINLVVNVYPIMVQRFNRARIAIIVENERRQRSSISLERSRIG